MTREEFEAGLAQVEREVTHRRAGVHGEGSISWEVSRETALFLAAGEATLLQLAHPFVAQAVATQSRTRDDPMKRFQRTFFHVFRVSFGDLDRAIVSARQIFAVHDRIFGTLDEALGKYPQGHPWEALDPHALYWVYATLVHSSLGTFDRMVRPLSREERDRYVAESRRFALLFGVPPAMLPRDHAEFVAIWDDWIASDRLAVGAHAKKTAELLLTPSRLVPSAIARWFRPVTRALLPPRIREQYGDAGLADDLILRSSVAVGRVAYRAFPETLRWVPAYREAERRVAGNASPDRVGRFVHRRALQIILG